jgi:hypothetical protein
MHNLHFVVVKAESGEEATAEVESCISDWGNENNWRHICGAVSEDNEVYKTGEGRYAPEDNETIETINTRIAKWLVIPNVYEELLGNGQKFEELTASQLNRLRGYIGEVYEQKLIASNKAARQANGEKLSDTFNVLTDTYRDYQYDEFGVTDICDDVDPYSENVKTWVVFVDMHS